LPYKTHPNLKEPGPDQALWRYTDFAKFAALVQTGTLFLPSLTLFDATDPWEGFPSKLNFDPNRPIEVEEHNDTSSRIYTTTQRVAFGDGFDNAMAHMLKGHKDMRRVFYVSCWHMNDTESDAQWRIYGGNDCALAVVTTFDRLKKAILDAKDVYGSEVQYYNQATSHTPDGNAFYPVICKRQAFAHEREFRLIYWGATEWNRPAPAMGVTLAVDLQAMIESIVVSPRSPAWFMDTLANFAKGAGLSVPVVKSDLLQPYT